MTEPLQWCTCPACRYIAIGLAESAADKNCSEIETARKDERAKVLAEIRCAFYKSAGDWDFAWFLVFGETYKHE